MQRTTQCAGVGIGGDSDEEEKALADKSGQSKSIQISSGQFDEAHSKEMGTDYDPPTRYDDDLGGMSADTLGLIEREMGIKLGGFLGETIAQAVSTRPLPRDAAKEAPKEGTKEESKAKKPKKKRFDRKVD